MGERVTKKVINYLESASQKQLFLTYRILLEYLREINPNINFFPEERLLTPILNFYLKNLNWFGGNIFPRRLVYSFMSLFGRVRLRRVKRLDMYRPGAVVSLLDIGCGGGDYYFLFKKSAINHFFDYMGIDIKEQKITACRARFPEAKFRVGNLLDLNFLDRSFDIVMVNRVFEHLPAAVLHQGISEALRITKDILIVNFFCERDIPEHKLTRVGPYQWCCLSRRRLLAVITSITSSVKIIDAYPQFSYGWKIETSKPISRSTWIIRKLRTDTKRSYN